MIERVPSFDRQMANLISQLRKDSGLNQLEFAKLCRVSFRTLQRIEAGEISPRIELLFRILKALNVQPNPFFLKLFNAQDGIALSAPNVAINTKISSSYESGNRKAAFN